MTKVTSYFSAGYTGSQAQAIEAFSGVSAMLDAIGLAKTADTGQINIPGVAVPVTNTYSGYEIRSWTDSLGTLYMKWEYGNVSFSLRYRITIGTGSDGAGNITGVFPAFNQLNLQCQSVNSYVQANNYACRSGDSWAIALYANTTGAYIPFMFDRQRDPVTGASVAGGYYTVRLNSNVLTCIATRPPDGWVITDANLRSSFGLDYVVQSNSGIGLEPAVLDVMPYFGCYPQACIQPVAMQYWSAEHMTPMGVFKATVYGATRTYIALAVGTTNYGIAYCGAASTRLGLAMIWE